MYLSAPFPVFVFFHVFFAHATYGVTLEVIVNIYEIIASFLLVEFWDNRGGYLVT
jgi:hypothetical protein